MSGIRGRIILGIALSLAIVAGGTLGYHFIEGWSLFESLYMTAITVTTVGFGEIRPLSETGRVLTLALMIFGVGIVLYLITTFSQMVVEGKLRQILGRRNVEKHIRSLRDHFIICGYGRIGSQVPECWGTTATKPLSSTITPTSAGAWRIPARIFFTDRPPKTTACSRPASRKAKGLVATVSSDADNVFITLTAKGMNPDLFVIARATEPGSELKLRRAGADKVVSPYFIGARRIAKWSCGPRWPTS